MNAELDSLEQRIGYRFRDRELLAQSLTHRSHAQTPREVDSNNERLEFLGDSVLGLAASHRLVEHFPKLPEGHLTKLKASLVRAENLVDVARRLKLGAYLRIGRGEEISGGRNKKGLLVNGYLIRMKPCGRKAAIRRHTRLSTSWEAPLSLRSMTAGG